MTYTRLLTILTTIYIAISSLFSFQIVWASPPRECANCEIEPNGPAHVSSLVVLDAIPKFEHMQSACPSLTGESTMMISPYSVRHYAQYRMRLASIFGREVDRFVPLTTLFGFYLVHEGNPDEPVLIVNYLAFRSTAWSQRVRDVIAGIPSTERFVVSNGRYLAIVMRTSHSKSDACYNSARPLFTNTLTEASKSTLKDDLSSALLRNILFVGGTILDTTESLTKDQVRALRPYKKSLYYLASVDKLTEDGSTLVSEFPNLEHLSLGPTPLSEADVKAIGKLKKLRIAMLGSNSINDKMLAMLVGLIKLEELSIRKNPITSVGIKSLSGFKSLLTLGLSDTNIDDEATSTISEFPKLEYLFLDRTKITDEGVKRLSKLKNLQFLSLIDCAITDAAVEALGAMPSLRTVLVSGTSISETGRRTLQTIRGKQLKIN